MKESPVIDGSVFGADEMKKALRRHDTSVFEQTLVFESRERTWVDFEVEKQIFPLRDSR